ncbi:hypothetical protein [Microbacterium panaciterrae]|uniref:Uncharacterized protein n=1 Tax=Microbacterium panaciterrae TaxID=985759 RepID=A0ABP8P7A4_9MICO
MTTPTTTPTMPTLHSEPEEMPDDATLAEIGRHVLGDVHHLRARVQSLRAGIHNLMNTRSAYSKMSPTFVESALDAHDHEGLRDDYAELAGILKRLAVLRDYAPPRASSEGA